MSGDPCAVARPAPSRAAIHRYATGIFVLLIWILSYRIIEPLSIWFTYSLLGFTQESRLGSAIQFFIFEVPKVLLLLVLIVYVVGVIRTFFTASRTQKLLAGRKQFVGNVLAAHLGIVTPFCSCSAIPLFIGFVESGVPLGVTFSFLVAAPMINEVAAIMLLGLFGARVALIYVASGLIIAIWSGWIIGRLKMERYVEDWVYSVPALQSTGTEDPISWGDRLLAGRSAVREIVSKVWPYIVAGIAVGAGIHGYVPTGFMASFMGKSEWWAVPAAVLIGVPMYSNAAGIIPIVHALLEKGAALGTALAFMMAVIGLSLPETIILRKVLKLRLIGVFLAVVASGIILTGYLFNWLL
jgi:uncharacterized protein